MLVNSMAAEISFLRPLPFLSGKEGKAELILLEVHGHISSHCQRSPTDQAQNGVASVPGSGVWLVKAKESERSRQGR